MDRVASYAVQVMVMDRLPPSKAKQATDLSERTKRQAYRWLIFISTAVDPQSAELSTLLRVSPYSPAMIQSSVNVVNLTRTGITSVNSLSYSNPILPSDSTVKQEYE